MNTAKRNNQAFSIAQILFWAILCLFPPMFTFLSNYDWSATWEILKASLSFQAPLLLLYFCNYYFIVPRFLFKKRSLRMFILVNILFIVIVALCSKYPERMQDGLGWLILFFSFFFFQVLIVICSTGMRYVVRWNEMELLKQEESRKNTEAELVWLKNQLNPHFLFNTLNNISSLVPLDADLAQESLGKLSDLLRYALYESNQKQVPLANEIEFMHNYIDLMRLRYSDAVDIRVDFPDSIPSLTVIPLLFISPIENAFKHGVNNRYPSFVHIGLTWDGTQIRFEIENSRHPKANFDRVGSGIGIENLRRRLELAYPGNHTYQQTDNESIYRIIITIKP